MAVIKVVNIHSVDNFPHNAFVGKLTTINRGSKKLNAQELAIRNASDGVRLV